MDPAAPVTPVAPVAPITRLLAPKPRAQKTQSWAMKSASLRGVTHVTDGIIDLCDDRGGERRPFRRLPFTGVKGCLSPCHDGALARRRLIANRALHPRTLDLWSGAVPLNNNCLPRSASPPSPRKGRSGSGLRKGQSGPLKKSFRFPVAVSLILFRPIQLHSTPIQSETRIRSGS